MIRNKKGVTYDRLKLAEEIEKELDSEGIVRQFRSKVLNHCTSYGERLNFKQTKEYNNLWAWTQNKGIRQP